MAKKKAAKKKSGLGKEVEEVVEQLVKEIVKISHYFDKIGVAVIELGKGLTTGDKIRIKGATSDFTQLVGSIEKEHKAVKKAKKGDAIGIKVEDKVRPNDKVYIVKE